MINLKNPSSSFMTSHSHHKVDVSIQEDKVVEYSRMKCSFMVGQDFVSVFLNLAIRKCPPKRYDYNPARKPSDKLKVEKQEITTEMKWFLFMEALGLRKFRPSNRISLCPG